jgi:hypothetical protein
MGTQLVGKNSVVIVPVRKEMKRINQSNGPLSCGLRCGHTCLLLFFSRSPLLPETDAIRPFPPGPGFSTVQVQGISASSRRRTTPNCLGLRRIVGPFSGDKH